MRPKVEVPKGYTAVTRVGAWHQQAPIRNPYKCRLFGHWLERWAEKLNERYGAGTYIVVKQNGMFDGERTWWMVMASKDQYV